MKTKPSMAILAVLMILTAGVVSPADAQEARQPEAPTELTDAEKLYGLSLLWQEVNYNFVFFDQVPELDWDSAYQAAIPRVLEAPTTWEYYRELQRLVALLNDGHTGVWMPSSLQEETFRRDTYPWVLTRNVDGRVVVRGVGESLIERVPLHSEIIEIDGRDAADVALERRLPFVAQSTEHSRLDAALGQALHGPADEPVRIRYVTPDGETRSAVLERDRRTRDDVWVPDVNAQAPPFELEWLDDGIARVALNTMADTMTAMGFEAALPELRRRARALIIDIRENGGGSSGVGYRVLSWLTDDTLATSRWRTREHRAAHKAWGRWSEERRAYFEMDAWFDGGTHGEIAPAEGDRLIVPTVILQDHATFSAAEDFLVAADALPHVTFVGRPTGGSTGQPLLVNLPGGGGFRVCTKRDTYPDGRDFVGVGVQPDIRVGPTLEALRAGRDLQLERAVEALARTR